VCSVWGRVAPLVKGFFEISSGVGLLLPGSLLAGPEDLAGSGLASRAGSSTAPVGAEPQAAGVAHLLASLVAGGHAYTFPRQALRLASFFRSLNV
jgi:hypothetical protein